MEFRERTERNSITRRRRGAEKRGTTIATSPKVKQFAFCGTRSCRVTARASQFTGYAATGAGGPSPFLSAAQRLRVPLFCRRSAVLPSFRCSAAVPPSFRRSAVVPPFRRSAVVPPFRRSAVPRSFRRAAVPKQTMRDEVS
jgi:hypothetical protein